MTMLDEISHGRVQLINGVMHRQPLYSAAPFPFVQADYDEFGQLVAERLVRFRHGSITLTNAGERYRVALIMASKP